MVGLDNKEISYNGQYAVDHTAEQVKKVRQALEFYPTLSLMDTTEVVRVTSSKCTERTQSLSMLIT